VPTLESAATAPSGYAAPAGSTGGKWRWHATAAAGEDAAAGRVRTTTTALGTTAGATGKSTSTGAAGLAAAARSAGLLVHEDERPLVVMVPALVEANRFFLALAHHAHHAAGDRAAEARGLTAAKPTRGLAAKPAAGRTGAENLRTGGAAAGRLRPTRTAGLPGATPAARLGATLAGNAAPGRNRQEVFPGDRVFEFLADVTPLDQCVETRRQGLRLRVVEPNRADVLLPAKHELGFFLALGLVTPHGHRDGHQDRHHGERHEQRRHRVTGLTLTP
jgi:hypothetical protein